MILLINCGFIIPETDSGNICDLSEITTKRIEQYDYIVFDAVDDKCGILVNSLLPVLLKKKVALCLNNIQEYLKIKNQIKWFLIDSIWLKDNCIQSQIDETDKVNYHYLKERFVQFDDMVPGNIYNFDRNVIHCLLSNLENETLIIDEMPDYRCAIIIPTNRHCFLGRIIDYYRHFKYPIKIADSSGEKYSFEDLPSNIQYFHLPDYSIYKKVSFVLEQSPAKYIMFIADDDFAFEPAIRKGIDYLEDNSDFSLVQGKWLGFNEGENVIYSIYSDMRDCQEDDAIIRCQNSLINYFMTFWALYRKDTLLNIYDILDELNLYYYRMNEIIQHALICYYGKTKFINCFLGAREAPKSKEYNERYILKTTKADIYQVFSEEFNKINNSLDEMVFKGFTKLVFDSYNTFFNKLYR